MKKILRFLKLVGIPFIIAFGIYSFIRFVWLADTKKEFNFQNIDLKEYSELYLDSKESIVLIVKDDTEKKSEYEEIIRKVFDGKYIDVYYLNITNLTDDELKQFESSTGLTDKKKYELPILVYTLNGQVYALLEGYQEIHYVRDFVERNNIG